MRHAIVAPHHDDAALFAGFLTMLAGATVNVVFKSSLQEERGTGVTNEKRELEERLAVGIMTADEPRFWRLQDGEGFESQRDQLINGIQLLNAPILFAPVVETDGHPEHNWVGQVARECHSNVCGYYTYTNGRTRNGSRLGHRVPIEPHMIGKKLRALACYESQHGLWSTAHHFTDHPLHEWTDRELA